MIGPETEVTHLYRDAYPPQHGGIEQHIHTLVHALKGSVKPSLLISGGSVGVHDDEGVPIESVGEWGRFQGAPVSPSLPLRVAKLKSDVLHFHMANPTGELAYLMSGSRTPAVATYHHDIVRQARAAKLYAPFLHAFLSKVERIIVATPQHITSSPILPAFKEKCRVVPYGIDLSRFEATPTVEVMARDLRQKYGPRIVLFVGKLRYYKGLDYLLRAMARIDGRAVILGKGTEEAKLRSLSDELRLGNKVVFLPHLERDEFLATLHACDVFALPSSSRMEMFGIAQLEAQACGKPAVCTALGTGVEYVNRHGETGLVVPPRDVEALAAALDQLLSNRDLAAQLGANARKRAHAEFSRERMALDTLRIYQEALHNSSPSSKSLDAHEKVPGQRGPTSG